MYLFKNRDDAGKNLAKKLEKFKLKDKKSIVLAVPRGGIPIGAEIAKHLNISFDLVIPRKLPIPFDPEAGFGAVINNEVVLNKRLLERINLSKKEINKIVKEVRKETRRRMEVYRGKKPLPKLKGKQVILVDDGLASGYTMLAAIKWARARNAKKIIVAVPVSSETAMKIVKPEADKLITLHISHEPIFAVASFYEEFPDLSDEDVVKILKNIVK